jgi:predicted regulator of Ras-like GTPase activity (Roadblock/LC7/MglB family)
MDNELYSFALKSTLEEIRSLCPDIATAFMFTEDGEIIASDENTPQQNMVRIVDDFDGLLEKAETMGGIEQIKIEGSKGGVNVSHLNEYYVVTITTENADSNYVNTMSRVLFTTVLKLLDKISPAPLKNNTPETKPELETTIEDKAEQAEQVSNEPEIKEAEQAEQPTTPETTHTELTHEEPQANQFMIEDLQGLLVKADTVRIDGETLTHWQQLYTDQRIDEVEIETFTGQSMRCKIKPIKDSKQEGKGIVQMPLRIQQALETKKGELVKLKPIVELEG